MCPCRPAGGHAGCTCQLQHHSQRAEAFLQQAARGARAVGESEARHGDLSWLSEPRMSNVLATPKLLPSHRQCPHHTENIDHVKPDDSCSLVFAPLDY